MALSDHLRFLSIGHKLTQKRSSEQFVQTVNARGLSASAGARMGTMDAAVEIYSQGVIDAEK